MEHSNMKTRTGSKACEPEPEPDLSLSLSLGLSHQGPQLTRRNTLKLEYICAITRSRVTIISCQDCSN